jgi:hypothetical protein
MKIRTSIACLALILGTACVLSVATKGNWLMAAEYAAAESKLAHNVYFTLNNSTPESRQELVDSCKKYLVNHPGVVFFACGTVVPDLDRPVNDLNFDVGLHIVFADRAAHDKYQTAPDHLKFIEENRANFKQVRVFDTYVDVPQIR